MGLTGATYIMFAHCIKQGKRRFYGSDKSVRFICNIVKSNKKIK